MRINAHFLASALATVLLAFASTGTASASPTVVRLHAFSTIGSNDVNADGAYPDGGPIQASDGNYYGTTRTGGAGGTGVIYRVTPSGTYSVFHDFGALSESERNTDGAEPDGGLLEVNGDFYGTAFYGGTGAYGTVFKITASGSISVLHNFSFPGTGGVNSDGVGPIGGVELGNDGNFYGVANDGGKNATGTIFKITPGGVFTKLHDFNAAPDSSDNVGGAFPGAGITLGSDGNFYGVAEDGGANATGTVFKITPAGAFTVLHNFPALSGSSTNTGGAEPFARLIEGSDGRFYGTTTTGGTGGAGTVFAITTSGALTTLHNFDGTDGNIPLGAMVFADDGNFYGTTTQGGTGGDNGTVFKISLTGKFTNVLSFNGTDGAKVHGRLIEGSDGFIYGATFEGGTNDTGTVFKFSIGLPAITSADTASATAGKAFSYQIAATNNPTSFSATGLPSGLSVNKTTGLISGTPAGTAVGTKTIHLTATNSVGSGTETLTLTIKAAAPVITSATTASATAGKAFSYQITANNAPTSFNATGLPSGLSINKTTGLISGTPASTAVGTKSLHLSASNSAGTGTETLILTISK